jgi:hypothetical protein
VTDDDVHELLSRYVLALNALDPEALAACYDEVATIVDTFETMILARRDAVRESMGARVRGYRDQGFVAGRIAGVEVDIFSERAAQADVQWVLAITAGELRFATRYWVAWRSGRPVIAAVLAKSGERTIVSS